jgi:hypothetical protein
MRTNHLRRPLILLVVLAFFAAPVFAQNPSPEAARKILSSYQWMLRRYEKGNQMYTVPEARRGMRLVFRDNGSSFSWMPSVKDASAELVPWNLTPTRITFGPNIEDARFTWSLENLAGYRLRLVDEDEVDGPTYVWEAEPLKPETHPKQSVRIQTSLYEGAPSAASGLIRLLNSKAKEAVGNIRFSKPGDPKITIEDASITEGGIGIRVNSRLSQPGLLTSDWVYEFRPEDIESVKVLQMAPESPVGIIRINLSETAAKISSYTKKEGLEVWYATYVNLNYLKVDPKNEKAVRDAVDKLREVFEEEREERLDRLVSFMDPGQNFWVSANGNSSTYRLDEVLIAGCSMRFRYYLSNVGSSGDTKAWYITEVPLDAIDEVTLDRAKSRPNTYILQGGKKGFVTYKENGQGRYSVTTSVSAMPLFIDLSNEKLRARVAELLKAHVKDCGGSKKLRVPE